uniref:Px n=1 Tax=Cynosurus mottle virus TaxID=2931826 RepID=A0A8T9JBZ3_9VIRU|nr:Px [Cynosurus mottle virus]WMX25419.1 Px protein [Cynosurus mottle virus]WMX25429.1 Px protein [Cynosurus mottle virus]WMX25434.1 Px protein [Cynosurus mottle virus]
MPHFQLSHTWCPTAIRPCTAQCVTIAASEGRIPLRRTQTRNRSLLRITRDGLFCCWFNGEERVEEQPSNRLSTPSLHLEPVEGKPQRGAIMVGDPVALGVQLDRVESFRRRAAAPTRSYNRG